MNDIWQHENQLAWCIVPFDTKCRGPVDRARMLRQMGFRRFGYDWRPKNVPEFEDELIALKREGIELLAWWFSFRANDPLASKTLELFRSHSVRPQLWIMQSLPDLTELVAQARAMGLPKGRDETNIFDSSGMAEAERDGYMRIVSAAKSELARRSYPKTEREQAARVSVEADRVAELVELARPFGCRIGLYNHGGWFGNVDNQLAIIDKLRRDGVEEVGMIYNFSHCRTPLYDDTADFEAIWSRIKDHVWAVNLSGIHMDDGTTVALGQGDGEKDMISVIDRSGWQGPVGLIGETRGDAAVTLAQVRRALDEILKAIHA